MEDEAEPMAAVATLSQANSLVPAALEKARSTTGFSVRWKSIVSKLQRIPPCLSDLSSHPCFARNALCRELLQSVSATLAEAIELADRCQANEPTHSIGKLQMQSDLDALAGKLDINLRDCGLLIKTGVLGDTTMSSAVARSSEEDSGRRKVRELLARLQIGHAEAKHWAVDGLLEAMKDDEKSVLAVLTRTNVSALVQLLAAATPPRTREKAAAVICNLAESGSGEHLLISEGALPSLIRLAESGTSVGREKAMVSLQRLSMSAETARSIVGHGGVRPLIEICQMGDTLSQSAAVGTLKNLSALPELRQSLSEEGIIKVMINLLDCGVVLVSKEYAAECLQNLTASNESLRRHVVSEGGIRSLLNYLDGPLPQEPAVAAVRNLASSVSIDTLISLGLIPRLVHVLKDGSLGAQQAAASTISKISSTMEVKRLVGEFGCMPLLIRLLETKTNGAIEVAVQATASLMSCPQNRREVKKAAEKSVRNLVQLLDPCPQSTAKKYAVSCLLTMSTSKKCRKLMMSNGAVGYLKKLSEMDVPGTKKLVERLERGKLRSLFSGPKL